MAILLLTTKLSPPPVPAARVSRSRLIARLDQTLEHGRKLTLICAPAGAGKTTLLAEWLSADAAHGQTHDGTDGGSGPPASFHTAWVSLDAGDNDPIRFWSYVLAAIATVDPSLVAPARAMLATPPALIELMLTLLINTIAGRAPLDRPIVLVLDDYHVIVSETIHQALVLLIDHLPPQMHLVLTSRADPPLPLARLRARGVLAELRGLDLRFTSNEAATFLTGAMGLALVPAEIAALEARTEGWITGLYLAALALRDQVDPGDFVAAFAHSTHVVVDYLMDEVFRQQPAHLQTFLLQTAILERFCGALCDAVLGVPPDDAGSGGAAYSELVLRQLEHANLFVVPLDADRQWYRYHQLFAEVLRARLHAGARREDVATLHHRAAVWFEQHGLIPEAVQHALAAHDWDHTARLIMRHSGALLQHGETATLLRWLDAVPPEEVRARPRLCLLYAWTLIGSRADPAAAVEPWVAAVLQHEAAADTNAEELRGEAFAVKATIATIQEDIAATIAFAEAALERLPPESRWQGQIKLSLGLAHTLAGDVTTARRILTEAAFLSRKTNAWHLVSIAESLLADLSVLGGQLDQAVAGYHQVLRDAADYPGLQRGSARAHGGLGHVLRERNQLGAAVSHVQASTDLYHAIGGAVRHGPANAVAVARIKQAQGDWQAAHAILDDMQNQARQAGRQDLVRHAAAWQARLHLAQGHLAAALRWADGGDLHVDDADLPFPSEVEYLTLARARIAEARAAHADHAIEAVLRLLARLLAAAEAAGRQGSAIEIRIVQALAYAAQGDRTHAQHVLEQALALAEPEGYVRTFVDEGAHMAVLLGEIAARDTPPARYARALLEAFPRPEWTVQPSPAASAPVTPDLVEPLSEREVEVLRLIAAGRSNQEIADSLIIALGTVKKHLNNLFGKLQVTSRTHAVARARELGIL